MFIELCCVFSHLVWLQYSLIASHRVGCQNSEMAMTKATRGQRLLPKLIDQLALEGPSQIFCSYASTPNASEGFQDVTYEQLARAINKCAWWIEEELGRSHVFKTLTYLGPHDIRYMILTLAAIKTGYKVKLDNEFARVAIR